MELVITEGTTAVAFSQVEVLERSSPVSVDRVHARLADGGGIVVPLRRVGVPELSCVPTWIGLVRELERIPVPAIDIRPPDLPGGRNHNCDLAVLAVLNQAAL